MSLVRKAKKQPQGAPDWMVTFADMMTLLLCFFVILVSMSELKQDRKFKKVMESIRHAFGYEGGLGTVPTDVAPEVSLLKILQEITIPDDIRHIGDARDPGIEEKDIRVTDVRPGYKLVLGGLVQFERFSDQLLPGRERVVFAFADKIKGLTNIVEIIGHTTREEVPVESGFKSKDDLALARTARIRDLLVEQGLDPRRLRLVSVADHEPFVRQAYTEAKRARNRRVEIVVTQALLGEFKGEKLSVEEKLNDGR